MPKGTERISQKKRYNATPSNQHANFQFLSTFSISGSLWGKSTVVWWRDRALIYSIRIWLGESRGGFDKCERVVVGPFPLTFLSHTQANPILIIAPHSPRPPIKTCYAIHQRKKMPMAVVISFCSTFGGIIISGIPKHFFFLGGGEQKTTILFIAANLSCGFLCLWPFRKCLSIPISFSHIRTHLFLFSPLDNIGSLAMFICNYSLTFGV